MSSHGEIVRKMNANCCREKMSRSEHHCCPNVRGQTEMNLISKKMHREYETIELEQPQSFQ